MKVLKFVVAVLAFVLIGIGFAYHLKEYPSGTRFWVGRGEEVIFANPAFSLEAGANVPFEMSSEGETLVAKEVISAPLGFGPRQYLLSKSRVQSSVWRVNERIEILASSPARVVNRSVDKAICIGFFFFCGLVAGFVWVLSSPRSSHS